MPTRRRDARRSPQLRHRLLRHPVEFAAAAAAEEDVKADRRDARRAAARDPMRSLEARGSSAAAPRRKRVALRGAARRVVRAQLRFDQLERVAAALVCADAADAAAAALAEQRRASRVYDGARSLMRRLEIVVDGDSCEIASRRLRSICAH